eukprot:167535-Hanusia_phi.AAC.2
MRPKGKEEKERGRSRSGGLEEYGERRERGKGKEETERRVRGEEEEVRVTLAMLPDFRLLHDGDIDNCWIR